MAVKMLIVQFQSTGTVEEFDRLVKIEEALIQGYSQNRSGVVDGHDFGAGQMNIYVVVKGSWRWAIDVAKAHLERQKVLDQAVIAKRLPRNDRYEVVWPVDFAGTFSVV